MFDYAKFERVSGGLQKLFLYDAGTDLIAAVSAADYFLDAKNELDKGDVIIAKTNSGANVDMLVVTSERGAASVTTVNGT